jgi:hypothetical protein
MLDIVLGKGLVRNIRGSQARARCREETSEKETSEIGDPLQMVCPFKTIRHPPSAIADKADCHLGVKEIMKVLEALALHFPHPPRGAVFLGSAALFVTLSGIFRPAAAVVHFRFKKSESLWEELYSSLAKTVNVFKNRHCSTVLAICRPKPVFSWTFRTSIYSWREVREG